MDPGGAGSYPKLRGPGDPSSRGGDKPPETKGASTTPSYESDHTNDIINSVEADNPSTTRSSEASRIRELIESTEYSDLGEKDSLAAFYKRIGYLPPLDDAVLRALKCVLPEDMETEAATGRISSSNNDKFEKGLAWRNVSLQPDYEDVDPQLQKLQDLKEDPQPASSLEKQVALVTLTEYHDLLWAEDRQKCKDQTQEAIFQRTMLISMIDRLNLIYGKGEGSKRPIFDYAVETPWNCPPMPTKAVDYMQYNSLWLTCPKPDLAVAFVRERLEFPTGFDWDALPPATQRLICYEGDAPEKAVRAFHFLAIEAKRVYKDIDDRHARNQCLNNASQALHNMYELFREADEGEESQEYTEMFFDKVRFFSIVATPKGMKIRVHRARVLKDVSVGITEDYPLQFTFTDYLDLIGKDFTYHRVAEELSNILYSYGAKVLRDSLQQAIAAVHQKFKAYRRQNLQMIYRDEKHYSHGQVPGPSRKRKNTSTSAIASRRNSAAGSVTSRPPPEALRLSTLQVDPAFISRASSRSRSRSSRPTSSTSRQRASGAKMKRGKRPVRAL